MMTILLLALVFNAGGSSIVYRSKPGIPLECSDTLRRFDRFLRELFLKSPYSKAPLTIEITENSGFKVRKTGGVLEIDRAALERQELSLLARAGGEMLRASGKAPENFVLPYFLAGAFRHRERSFRNEGRFLGNNRKLRSVESCAREGGVPDFLHILSFLPDTGSAVEERWFDDHAKLLLELTRGSGFKGSVEQISDAAMKAASAAVKDKSYTLLIWNNFNPLPPRLVRGKLDEMLKVEIPPLPELPAPVPGAKSEATPVPQKSETVHASLLPLKTVEHPLRRAICTAFARSLLRRGSVLPAGLRPALRQLHDETLRLGRDPERAKHFAAALENLEKDFQLLRERSEFLDRQEFENEERLWYLRHLWELDNSSAGGLLAPECAAFLKRMESIYSGI